MESARETVEKLLGCRIICTLSDGRTAEGRLICLDRLSNIILADCTERRILKSSDYNELYEKDQPPVEREVTRHLRQAMVPGMNLVKVEMDESTYNEKINAKDSLQVT